MIGTLALRRPGANLRRLVSEKLGVCPFCMRWSARGTITGWLVTGALSVTWRSRPGLVVASLVASSFTLLFIAHIVAYAMRVVWAYSAHVRRAGSRSGTTIDRRQFLRIGLQAAGAAASVALLGRTAFADGKGDCDGTHKATARGPNSCSKELATKPTQTAMFQACAFHCTQQHLCTFFERGEKCLMTDTRVRKEKLVRVPNSDCPRGSGWQWRVRLFCDCKCQFS